MIINIDKFVQGEISYFRYFKNKQNNKQKKNKKNNSNNFARTQQNLKWENESKYFRAEERHIKNITHAFFSSFRPVFHLIF